MQRWTESGRSADVEGGEAVQTMLNRRDIIPPHKGIVQDLVDLEKQDKNTETQVQEAVNRKKKYEDQEKSVNWKGRETETYLCTGSGFWTVQQGIKHNKNAKPAMELERGL